MANYLCSFPRSGNHLVRFFIELLSGMPTSGCPGNRADTPIYRNRFPQPIPFDIRDERDFIYCKTHCFPSQRVNNLIFIVRNPREALPNFCKYRYDAQKMNDYFQLIDRYGAFKGNKMVFFYEDILTEKKKFIQQLYNFLSIDEPGRLKYALDNADDLFHISRQGSNRAWGGAKSNGQLHYHYERLSGPAKQQFDTALSKKLNDKKYLWIKQEYSL